MCHPTISYTDKSAATSAMFLWEGLVCGRQDGILNAWGNGCIELAIEVSQYAVFLARICDRLALEDLDFPGVYDYEVSEEVGLKVGNSLISTLRLPSHESILRLIGDEAFKFFTQDESDPKVKEHLNDLIEECLK